MHPMRETTQTASAADTTDSVSRRIADFATTLDAGQLPAAVLSHAEQCILDAIGTALAARSYAFTAPVLAACQALGEGGEHVVFGQRSGLPLRDAAFTNGTLIHSLDFDDTHADSVVHCSASAWPVAFNLGLARGCSGREALAAYILAVEVDARIGAVAKGVMQRRGFHPTGIVGAFGAAAAAARLLGLAPPRIADALGIVLSMASGSMAFVTDGAWTKRIHPGWAAQCGITAAYLAQQGFVGPAAPIEGRLGLFDSLLGAEYATAAHAIGEDFGHRWCLADIAVKPYPACHFNHVYADCALELAADESFDVDDIERITALVHPDEAAIVCEPRTQKIAPAGAYEAQFSVPWIVAAALIRGRFTLAELDQDALLDERIRALAARIEHADDPDSTYPQYYSGGLVVTLRDGRSLRRHRRAHRGSDLAPLDETDIVNKFFANATRHVDETRAARIAAAVRALTNAPDLDELAQALRCEPRHAAAAS